MKTILLLISISIFSQHSLADLFKEPGTGGMYIAEWDLSFPDLETMNKYYSEKNNKSIDLIVNIIGHMKTFDIWSKSQRRNLSYCVSDDFKDRKNDVVEAMKVATQDWMDTGADIRFIYKRSEDKNCNEKNTRVTFDIRPVNFGGYLARAFFPSYQRDQRNIMIDSSSFKYSFVSFTGFLRHELGHVLGFRHEHISKDNNTRLCPESRGYVQITPYDQLSVMHYPHCGGKNDINNMILSELDMEGILKVYSR